MMTLFDRWKRPLFFMRLAVVDNVVEGRRLQDVNQVDSCTTLLQRS
jgi:hypothetical protein